MELAVDTQTEREREVSLHTLSRTLHDNLYVCPTSLLSPFYIVRHTYIIIHWFYREQFQRDNYVADGFYTYQLIRLVAIEK